jgi:hypothetical protein
LLALETLSEFVFSDCLAQILLLTFYNVNCQEKSGQGGHARELKSLQLSRRSSANRPAVDAPAPRGWLAPLR